MPNTPKKFYVGQATDFFWPLYVVPAGRTAVIKQLFVSNPGAQDITYTIEDDGASKTASPIYGMIIPPGTTHVYDWNLFLSAGRQLIFWTDAGPYQACVAMYGFEVS